MVYGRWRAAALKHTSGTSVTGPAAINQSAWLVLKKSPCTLLAAGCRSSQPIASGTSIQVSTTSPGSAATGACLRIRP
ncbi:hypothetical protein D3C80_1906300 [compost metagenome]